MKTSVTKQQDVEVISATTTFESDWSSPSTEWGEDKVRTDAPSGHLCLVETIPSSTCTRSGTDYDFSGMRIICVVSAFGEVVHMGVRRKNLPLAGKI